MIELSLILLQVLSGWYYVQRENLNFTEGFSCFVSVSTEFSPNSTNLLKTFTRSLWGSGVHQRDRDALTPGSFINLLWTTLGFSSYVHMYIYVHNWEHHLLVILLTFSHVFLSCFSTVSSFRSRSYSRSPFSRSYSRSRSRSRSRSYSYSPSRSRSRSRSYDRSYPRSPYSRRNGRSYGRSRTRTRSRSRSYGYRRSTSPRSPLAYRGGGWEGGEGAGPYRSRSRSRSPGGFRSHTPDGRKPPPRELGPYELKGLSPGSQDRWERERYRQWEKEYADWYNKYYKDFENQHPSLYPRGRGSRDRDRERERSSPLSRNYSPEGRGRRGRDDRGAPHHPPSSSSSGAKSSTKVVKSKKVKKRKPGDELEPSQQSLDRGDATPVRDEPMDEVPSPVKTPPVSSKPQAGDPTKSPASKSTAAAAKPSAKSASKSQSDKSKKERNQKVKAKVKTECVKSKSDKIKKKNGDGAINKKDSFSSSASKPAKPLKVKSEDASKSTNPKKEKSKSSSTRPGLLKTPPLSSQNPPLHHPSIHDGLQPSHDPRGRRDTPQGGGLLPLPTQHGHALLPPPLDSRRRMGEDSRSLLGSPPGKLRRTDNLGGELMPHPHMSHQPLLSRLPHFERPGLLPLPGSREMGRGDMDRGPIRPLIDLQVGFLLLSCWTFLTLLVEYVTMWSSFKVRIVSIAQLNVFVTLFFCLV